jgi:hypothetical protein
MNSIQNIGVIINAKSAILEGIPCTIESAPREIPVENNTNNPNSVPNTGINMGKQSIKLLVKIATDKEAKSSFSVII